MSTDQSPNVGRRPLRRRRSTGPADPSDRDGSVVQDEAPDAARWGRPVQEEVGDAPWAVSAFEPGPETDGPPGWDDDLDRPPPPRPPAPPPDRRGVVLTALVLTALAVGALAGALISPPAPPRPPPSVTMAPEEAYLADGPVLVVRLTVGNPGDERARLTGLVVEGGGARLLESLDVTVPPGGSATADVRLHPRCPGNDRAARAHVISPSEPQGVIPVSLTRALAAVNGLCAAVDTRLPSGWSTERPALGTVVDGGDLVVTVGDLSGDRLSGITVDDQFLPTVFVRDRLLTSSARLRPGENTVLRLRGPPPCIVDSAGAPAPTTLRLLAHGDDSLVQRLVAVGPELTRWVRLGCTENR